MRIGRVPCPLSFSGAGQPRICRAGPLIARILRFNLQGLDCAAALAACMPHLDLPGRLAALDTEIDIIGFQSRNPVLHI